MNLYRNTLVHAVTPLKTDLDLALKHAGFDGLERVLESAMMAAIKAAGRVDTVEPIIDWVPCYRAIEPELRVVTFDPESCPDCGTPNNNAEPGRCAACRAE